MGMIKKAVFPIAGLGTRFLPATKASAKEMLPVVDKPLIQYAVEEAVAAGITELIFITGRSKRAIEDHFGSWMSKEGHGIANFISRFRIHYAMGSARNNPIHMAAQHVASIDDYFTF